jgi:hypothetical protein
MTSTAQPARAFSTAAVVATIAWLVGGCSGHSAAPPAFTPPAATAPTLVTPTVTAPTVTAPSVTVSTASPTPSGNVVSAPHIFCGQQCGVMGG